MHKLLLVATFLLASGASAQTTTSALPPTSGPARVETAALNMAPLLPEQAASAPAAPATSGWGRIQALKPGTKLRITTKSHAHITCELTSVDAQSLSCGTSNAIQQAEIQSIKVPHHLRSSLTGVGIGIAAALGVGIGLAEHCRTLNCSAAFAVAVAVVTLAILVAVPIIAGVTDFTAPTIYKAPTP